MDLRFRDDFTVEAREVSGSDDSVVRAMLVSTQGAESLDASATPGRINFLMANRHGTPFEHASMTFYVEAPIFVFREWHRHRIGVSINEVSGRYRELDPTFYVPPPDRPMVQVGKPGHYEFVAGDPAQHELAVDLMKASYTDSYRSYRSLLEAGVAKEVARVVLPVGIYSAMYWTCNPRSLMAFLSLRTKHTEPYEFAEGREAPPSTFPSYPQWEIEQCASQMERVFARHFPMTHAAFCANGRVAP